MNKDYEAFVEKANELYEELIAEYYKLTDNDINEIIDKATKNSQKVIDDIEWELKDDIKGKLSELGKKYDCFNINVDVTVKPKTVREYRHDKEHDFYFKRSVFNKDLVKK